MQAPGCVGQHFRRRARLRGERLTRQASNRLARRLPDRWRGVGGRRRISQERDGARIADPAQGRGGVGRELGVGAVEHGQKGRDRRAIEPPHVSCQQSALLGRNAGSVERVDQEGNGVRTGFPEPGDRVFLLLG